ncbi:MAG TPA: hypothetical protein VHH11_09700 [Gammaproteobacteria bacterium]|jgi:hypothetical protein|nr:hypothetical protein [Gammaproteobacteria bacterium]
MFAIRLTWALATLAFFLGVSALMVSARVRTLPRGRATVLAAAWLIGTGVTGALGARQYGVIAMLPAAFATAFALLVCYLVVGRGSVRDTASVVLLVCVASVVATIALVVALLAVLAALGIDGP